jgi:hypothetical protein
MFAAAKGHSNIGIPKKVAEDFVAADEARGPHKLPAKAAHEAVDRVRAKVRHGR